MAFRRDLTSQSESLTHAVKDGGKVSGHSMQEIPFLLERALEARVCHLWPVLFYLGKALFPHLYAITFSATQLSCAAFLPAKPPRFWCLRRILNPSSV